MVNINLEEFGKWQPLFSYEGILLDIEIEYKITDHKDGAFSVAIRDLMKGDSLLVSLYRGFNSLEEVNDYLSNYYNKLEDFAAYESQLKFSW